MSSSRQPNGPEKARATYDVVVAGGGLIGLACAWRAAEAGLGVCVVERDRVGAGASGVAAGMLAPASESVWGQEPLARACLDSAGRWPGFAAELSAASGLPVELSERGGLHVALDRDEGAELKRRLPLIEAADPDARWLTGSECRELEPGLGTGAGPGVEVPGEAAVDPRRVLEALGEAARKAGVELLEGAEPSSLHLAHEAIRGVELSDGRHLACEQVVVATGADPAALGWLAPELRPAVRRVKGEILRLSHERGIVGRTIHTERVYLLQRPGGEVVVGATTDERATDLEVRAGAVRELLREAYRVLPEIEECAFREASAGYRPASPDGLPIVGVAAEGLLHACAHNRNGVLLAPLTADAITGLLAGESPPASTVPFAPRPEAGPDREQARR